MVYTFWEGVMPAYIKLCLNTWHIPFTVLNYDNLHSYTELPLQKLKRYPLAQQADCIRVHVLRDNGGYWLDADTILLINKLPDVTILGDNSTRINSVGYLHTVPRTDMFVQWAAYQDNVLNTPTADFHWAMMGNAFTDKYLKQHKEITIGDIYKYWLETNNDINRQEKYLQFYFEQQHRFKDVNAKDMIMLHNSWTPEWYKQLSRDEALANGCTLSNILREVT